MTALLSPSWPPMRASLDFNAAPGADVLNAPRRGRDGLARLFLQAPSRALIGTAR